MNLRHDIASTSLRRPVPARAVLDRILEEPQLVKAVQALPALVLTRLIGRVGLEDAGELAALMTPEQVERVFDVDLWRAEEGGADAAFDAERFALWLEVWVEQSPALAARKLAELDLDLAVLALTSQLLVLDTDSLEQHMAQLDPDEGEQIDKRLDSGLYHELEQYRVSARDMRSWNAWLLTLVELHGQDFESFGRLMARAAAVCGDQIDHSGGLYAVLSAGETLAEDVGGARTERREQAGYVAPSDALAFLRLTLDMSEQALAEGQGDDAITRHYSRVFSDAPKVAEPASAAAGAPEGSASLWAALNEAGLFEEGDDRAARALPSGSRRRLLPSALRRLADAEPEAHDARVAELAYLANVLIAAFSEPDASVRPVDAAEAALALANLGAELYVRGAPDNRERLARAGHVLQESRMLMLFQRGVRWLADEGARLPVVDRGLLETWRTRLARLRAR